MDEEITEDIDIDLDIDEDEVLTPGVKAETNPNVADQLSATATEGTQTIEERYKALQDSDPELSEYHGKNVKKRIDKMTYKLREGERQTEEAMTYAKGVLASNTELENKLLNQDGAFIGEHKTRLTSELEQANQAYNDAYNQNDPVALAKATGDIARVSTALQNAESTQTRFTRRKEEHKEKPVPTFNPPQQRPKVDSKAEEWAQRNEWFGDDKEVTQAAMAIHKQLSGEGIVTGSPGYYSAIDERLQRSFPDKEYWGKEVVTTTDAPAPTTNTPSNASVVTPVNNLGGVPKARGRTVKLTASQRAVAKKLGITDQQYAKSMVAMDH